MTELIMYALLLVRSCAIKFITRWIFYLFPLLKLQLKKPNIPDHHAHYTNLNYDNSLNLEEFKRDFQIKILQKDSEKIVFDLINANPSIANTLRRIFISDVPTVAIETVYIQKNTSVIPDEVLAHRLGLIPIKADPRHFEMRQDKEYTDKDTLVFSLDVKCQRVQGTSRDDPEDVKYVNSRIYSKDLVWVPQGDQIDWYPNGIRPVHEDIPITYLRPNQEIKLVCYCEKNVGREHAKWSPVCTASYKLLSHISFTKPIKGEKAKEIVNLCPMKVFDLEDTHAVVSRPRDCTICRECIRSEENQQLISIEKQKNYFIFTVETTGVYKPEEIVVEGIKILHNKIKYLQDEYKKLNQNT